MSRHGIPDGTNRTRLIKIEMIHLYLFGQVSFLHLPTENKMTTLASLIPLFAFFSFLLCVVFAFYELFTQIHSGFADSTALLFWCLISSCLGSSIRQSLSQLWHYSVLGAMSQDNARHSRSRHAYGEEEIWEMEYRGRAG